jgi:hypothetical protein
MGTNSTIGGAGHNFMNSSNTIDEQILSPKSFKGVTGAHIDPHRMELFTK